MVNTGDLRRCHNELTILEHAVWKSMISKYIDMTGDGIATQRIIWD